MGEKTTFGLHSVLTFGKYKGLKVAAVLRFNPLYFQWAVNNVPWFDLDPEARKIGQRAINAERDRSIALQDGWCWGFGRSAKKAADDHRINAFRIELDERRKAAGRDAP